MLWPVGVQWWLFGGFRRLFVDFLALSRRLHGQVDELLRSKWHEDWFVGLRLLRLFADSYVVQALLLGVEAPDYALVR